MKDIGIKMDLLKQLIDMMRGQEVDGFKDRKKPKAVVVEQVSVGKPEGEEMKEEILDGLGKSKMADEVMAESEDEDEDEEEC